VLIFYHTGMYYVSWDWHVKSPFASDAIEPLMILSSPWRLGLLFMISGVATAFMLQKLRIGALLRQRSWRLLLPLIFGMFVIVPPQAYFEVVEKIAIRAAMGNSCACTYRATTASAAATTACACRPGTTCGLSPTCGPTP
jgi:hypothetical protein